MKKKFFCLKALIVLISVSFLSAISFAEKVELKKKASINQKVVKYADFKKINVKVDSGIDTNKYHAIRFICENNNNMRLIVKVKANVEYKDAVAKGQKAAVTYGCKLPKVQNFYTYSYGCNNMQTNQWDTFVDEEVWITDFNIIKQNAEKIAENKKKSNPKAYKNASCGGGGSNSGTKHETELNLKETNLKVLTAK